MQSLTVKIILAIFDSRRPKSAIGQSTTRFKDVACSFRSKYSYFADKSPVRIHNIHLRFLQTLVLCWNFQLFFIQLLLIYNKNSITMQTVWSVWKWTCCYLIRLVLIVSIAVWQLADILFTQSCMYVHYLFAFWLTWTRYKTASCLLLHRKLGFNAFNWT